MVVPTHGRAGSCRAFSHERSGRMPGVCRVAVQSNFSFLRGASNPEELVLTAALLGHAGMGLADRNSVAGVVRAWSPVEAGRRPEEPGAKGSALPSGRAPGLCRRHNPTCSPIRRTARDGSSLPPAHQANCAMKVPRARRWSIAAISWSGATTCRSPSLPTSKRIATRPSPSCAAGQSDSEKPSAWPWRRPIMGTTVPLEQAKALADAADMRLMAVNDVIYHSSERRPLQDVLNRDPPQRPVAEAGFALLANAERHMKTPGGDGAVVPAPSSGDHRDGPLCRRADILAARNSAQLSRETTEKGVDPQTELERLAWGVPSIATAAPFPRR